jgi:hypothetical protein
MGRALIVSVLVFLVSSPLRAQEKEVPIALERGDPAPSDGVWMSVALASEKARNCTLWQETGDRCLARLKDQPSQLSVTAWMVGSIVAVVLVGWAGFELGRLTK